MGTECSYDYVFVYDGDSFDAPLLGSFSGKTEPQNVTASSGYVSIYLVSFSIFLILFLFQLSQLSCLFCCRCLYSCIVIQIMCQMGSMQHMQYITAQIIVQDEGFVYHINAFVQQASGGVLTVMQNYVLMDVQAMVSVEAMDANVKKGMSSLKYILDTFNLCCGFLFLLFNNIIGPCFDV